MSWLAEEPEQPCPLRFQHHPSDHLLWPLWRFCGDTDKRGHAMQRLQVPEGGSSWHWGPHRQELSRCCQKRSHTFYYCNRSKSHSMALDKEHALVMLGWNLGLKPRIGYLHVRESDVVPRWLTWTSPGIGSKVLFMKWSKWEHEWQGKITDYAIRHLFDKWQTVN